VACRNTSVAFTFYELAKPCKSDFEGFLTLPLRLILRRLAN